MIRTAILVALLASPAASAEFEFCWQGAGGFTLSGRMSVPDATLSQSRVTETDVTAFTINAARDGMPIGGWSMADLTQATSWNLNFDPAEMAFTTGGYSNTDEGQQWNANGNVNNCGDPGVGFNSGGGGQDICVDNQYRTDSIIAHDTPLPVYPVGKGPICANTPLLCSLTLRDISAS